MDVINVKYKKVKWKKWKKSNEWLQRRIREVKDKLIDKYGYNEQSAQDVLEYVSRKTMEENTDMHPSEDYLKFDPID